MLHEWHARKPTLETAKVLMRSSSSRMLPWLADSICRMVSSSRLSSAFMRALFTIRMDFISDRSGRSYMRSASIEGVKMTASAETCNVT